NAVLWANRQSFLTQDGALFTSTEDRDWAQKQYPMHAPKALYQPNGVSTQYYFPERYSTYGEAVEFPPLDWFALARSSMPRLLFVGDWLPARDTLPHVFGRLHQRYPQLQLSLSGPQLAPEEVLPAFDADLRPAVSVMSHQDELARVEAYQ